MPKWAKTIIVIFLVAWALRFPPTRMIITWLLPLGSGWDDVVIIILLLIAGIIYSIKATRYGPGKTKRKRWIKDFFK